MTSTTLSADTTVWLLLMLAVACLVALSYARYGRCRACRSGWRVPRTGRYGPFLGCTNFPRCRGATLMSGRRIPLATRGTGPLGPYPRRGRDWNLLLLQATFVILILLGLYLLH
jgi:hypothetical protein